ncbi:MAG TPA: hypothetical protein DEO84_11405 [candidate division Zixibacteria bacterium]|nr:hypothetical protein [candidate division Zixibacteria bacterium]
MQNSFVIVTILIICNFLIFLALALLILKVRRRQSSSSFKQIAVDMDFESIQAREMPPRATVENRSDTACCGKCQSQKSKYVAEYYDGDKIMQKNELLPID